MGLTLQDRRPCNGWLYAAAGRLAAEIEEFTLSKGDDGRVRCTFTVIPGTVRAFVASHALSHCVLVVDNRTYVFRAVGGFVADGYTEVERRDDLTVNGKVFMGERLPKA